MDLLDQIKDLSNELSKTRDELISMTTELKDDVGILTEQVQTIKVFDKKKDDYIRFERDDFHQNTYSFIKSFKAFSKSIVGVFAFILLVLQIINMILSYTK